MHGEPGRPDDGTLSVPPADRSWRSRSAAATSACRRRIRRSLRCSAIAVTRPSLIGKWHLGLLPKYGPRESGYEEFWGLRGGGVDYFTHRFAGAEDLWDGATRIEENGYLTELLADRAIRTLEARTDDRRPFLISLHFTAPHWPWEGPGDRAESARLDAIDDPAALAHYDGGSLATYAEMVTFMDRQVGRVLARLAELGLDRDTIVVFTSDNGGERFSDTWPFTGRKTELLEGGIRIPAIVRWPGVSAAGSTNEQPIMTMDWLPTLLAAAGGAPRTIIRPTASTSGLLLPGAPCRIVPCSGGSATTVRKRRGTAAGNISGLKATTSCSTSSPTRSSAPTSRAATRTSSPAWSRPGRRGTPACCPTIRQRAPTASPARCSPTISAWRTEGAGPAQAQKAVRQMIPGPEPQVASGAVTAMDLAGACGAAGRAVHAHKSCQRGESQRGHIEQEHHGIARPAHFISGLGPQVGPMHFPTLTGGQDPKS
jgi:hypothetical protein